MSNPKPVKAEVFKFKSLSECARYFGISKQALTHRLRSNSNRFKNWYYVDKEKSDE